MKKHYLMISGLCSLLLLSGPVMAEENVVDGKAKTEFKENGDILPPVDPEKPGVEKPVVPVHPPTEGPLSINYASDIKFGKHVSSNKDLLLYAKEDTLTSVETGESTTVANFVQVTDLRGSAAGWTLSVKQSGPLVNEVGQLLQGSKLAIEVAAIDSHYGMPGAPSGIKQRQELREDGETFQLVKAEKGTGMGKWNIYIGSTSDVTKNVSLTVPGEAKASGKYHTQLIWQLQDAL